MNGRGHRYRDSMLRRRKRAPAEPVAAMEVAALPPRWRVYVSDAIAAREQWHELVARMPSGPVNERLSLLSARIDSGVLAVWETARRAAEAEAIADTLDIERITAEHKRALREADPDPEITRALAAKFTSAQRILNAVDDAQEQLRILDIRLGAAVARAAELAVSRSTDQTLETELDAVVSELGALREALDGLE